MSSWQVYWWLKLTDIGMFLMMVGFIGGIITTILSLVSAGYNEDTRHLRWLWLNIIWVSIFIIGLLLPSTKEYAVIQVLPKITQSKVVQQIPEDMETIYTMAKDYLKDMLKEAGSK